LVVYRKENINHDLEIFSELVLVSRILYKRLKISKGFKTKNDKYIEQAKIKILKEIEDDKYNNLIKNFINKYNVKKIIN
tara:strand:+ start:149 stop:385 length:237 start_codon:yes stop_codon:yes gene_type:complete